MESNYTILLINPDELVLKGRNQDIFKQKLKKHIRAIVRVFHKHEFAMQEDERRFSISSAVPFREQVVNALKLVPGIHTIHLARKVKVDFSALVEGVLQEVALELASSPEIKTFKFETKRSYKAFSHGSVEISRELGGHILRQFPQLTVDVKHPDLKIFIRVLSKGIYIYSRSIRGIGGLPISSTGHMVTMLSGGFDSPVASYMMAKRGVEQTFVFFHAYPFVGDEVKEKIFALAQVMMKFQRHLPLYIVPFGRLQKIITEHCKEDYRTIFFRRFMVEATTLLAEKVGAEGIITGDALGQVSSQTLPNMTLINECTHLPIIRPLIGMNKMEIIDISRKIGTHDISVIAQDDACSMLAPKHPTTNPNRAYWESFKKEYDFSNELRQCVEESQVYFASWEGNLYGPYPMREINKKEE